MSPSNVGVLDTLTVAIPLTLVVAVASRLVPKLILVMLPAVPIVTSSSSTVIPPNDHVGFEPSHLRTYPAAAEVAS